MATETLEPKGMYAGGKAIGAAKERRLVVAYLRRYANAYSVESLATHEERCAVLEAIKGVAACIASGHHAEQ